MDIVLKINATIITIITVMVIFDTVMEWDDFDRPKNFSIIGGYLLISQLVTWPLWVILQLWGVI